MENCCLSLSPLSLSLARTFGGGGIIHKEREEIVHSLTNTLTCTGEIFRVEVPQVGVFQSTCPVGHNGGDEIVMHFPDFNVGQAPLAPPPYENPQQFQQFQPNPPMQPPPTTTQPEPPTEEVLVIDMSPFEPSKEFVERTLSIDADEVKVPSEFVCPITQEIMINPVIAVDGHTYERKSMEKWLQSHDTSPKTNEHLPLKVLIPNIALRQRFVTFNVL